MDQYSAYIHASRYARWIEEENRRETWEETIDRYIGFFQDKTDNNPNIPWEELRDGIRNMNIMPSMRAMMTAGKALERDNVAGYNPVVGSTPVLTKEYGMVPIESLNGTTATVLNINSNWTTATFQSYGKQSVKRVVLKLNSNTINEVDCTDNHRWVLSDGTVKATSELQSGDRIDFVSAPRNPDTQSIDYHLGLIHGLVYGDGTTTYSCERVKGYHIRLAADSDELLPLFENYPISYPPTANGDPVVQMYDGFAKTHSLKSLPSPDETDDYLIGFIRGWMAADGSVTKSSQVSICMCAEGKEWFLKNAPRFGYVTQREYQQSSETNYGKRRKESWVLYISRSSLTPEDFIITRKKDRFKELASHYVVSDIIDLNESAEVFCAEVPDTNTFVLSMGLVTGNCSYVAVDHQKVFDEIMYVLMCGTGVGFSVERQFINKLPEVPDEIHETDTTIVVSDSKIGWASAYRQLISLLYAGQLPKWDTSRLRPAGARLKTFGGRASGPEPLEDLFNFTCDMFNPGRKNGDRNRGLGRKLNSIECHDLVCKIADIVVCGGVRRSALISLSNLTDERMRRAKSGDWWLSNDHRKLANNSVCYTELPDIGIFMREWQSLYDSKSGERGIFNRVACKKMSPERRDTDWDFGTNPCSEIILRSKQFCNLSEVVIRNGDTLEELKRKVRLATILGTLQATLTDFRYLSAQWKNNTMEERLLGVSLTGIMDHSTLASTSNHAKSFLQQMKQVAVNTNEEFAARLGIPMAAAITCVKPSGTVSQLVNSASGLHPRYSQYYIRTVRQDKKDPLADWMIDHGFPVEEELKFDGTPPTNWIFSFPVKGPSGSVFRNDMTALEQLDHWKFITENWCEHKPSITVYVREHEWLDVGAWVYRNFDMISGISFLPYDGGTYRQAPYQEIDEEAYRDFANKIPSDVSFSDYMELDDHTTGSQELACAGGACEIA